MMTRRNALELFTWATAAAVVAPVAACGNGSNASSAASDLDEVAFVMSTLSRTPADQSALDAAAESARRFAMDVFDRLDATGGNVACSPLSIVVALAMARNGARGKTAVEMDEVLHSTGLESLNAGMNSLALAVEDLAADYEWVDGTVKTVELGMANSLWGQAGVSWGQDFLDDMATDFGAGMRVTDYAVNADDARDTINTWVSEQTGNRIPELLKSGSVDTKTRLVLVNALYLKAPWQGTFRREDTRPFPFTRGDGSVVEVDMMARNLYDVAVAAGPGWRAARLPYVGGRVAMTVVVPDDPAVSSLAALLGDGGPDAALTDVTSAPTLHLDLPRWKFRAHTELSPVLKELGLVSALGAFDTDFSRMSDEALYITSVPHEAFISVDEDGTEAAAATAVVMDAAISLPMPPDTVLTVDRRFFFVIHDVATATPLFVGRVDDPTS